MKLWVAVLLSAILCGLAVAAWALFGGNPPRPIRMAINPWPGYEPLFLARDRGIFAAHGLDVQLVELSSVGDCLRSYQQGDVDGLCATLVEVELASRHGRQGPPRIVIIPDTSSGADVILGRSPISSVKELRGKKIAVEPAGLGVFILRRALTLHGLSLGDVTLVPVGQEDMAAAFTSGKADAAVTYSPYNIEIGKAGGVKLFSTAEIPGEVVDVIVLSAGLATPEVVAKWRAVWKDLMDLIAREPDACIAAMAKRQNITAEESRRSLEGVTMMTVSDQERLLAPGGPVERSRTIIRDMLPEAKPVDVR